MKGPDRLELLNESCPHEEIASDPPDEQTPETPDHGAPDATVPHKPTQLPSRTSMTHLTEAHRIQIVGETKQAIEAPVELDVPRGAIEGIPTERNSDEEQVRDEPDDTPPAPPGEGYVLTSHGWIKGEQPPDEATTDDDEDIVIDRTKTVADDKDIPMETDPVSNEESAQHDGGIRSISGCSLIPQ
jgi:hypothetical protein